MALTQSARLPGPSWDEEVVPALRKRLESESRTLARRLSTLEDSEWSDSGHGSHSEHQKGFAGGSRTRPVQISDQSERVNSGQGRARTYSQPYSMLNGKANGIASSSNRPASPKPTRIPKASTRSHIGSKTTPPLNGYSDQTFLNSNNWNGYSPTDPAFSYSDNSHSTISIHNPQSSGLLQEPPPFSPGSTSSSLQNSHDILDDVPPRPSEDSEEHPFEHWYRGEVSRNGGVGELRVGRRKEMLDIANYGHPLKSRDPPAVRNAITDAIDKHRVRRTRADSIGGIGTRERESFYMDEERANEIARVLDETPLTDFEGETSDAGNNEDYYDQYSHAMHVEMSTSSEPPIRSTTPTLSNIPRPSSRQRTTPTPMSRGMSEPPPSASSTRTQQPRSASTNSTPKRASPGTPSAKKSRTAASKATRAKLEAARKEEDQNRRSVAYYPTPDDNMENAIPQWTQPVPVDGNWDNVVLPVVARKQGLNGYETTDGKPKPKPADPVAPAPGTFGYDHSKYRPPRAGDEFEPVQLDEFGRPRQPQIFEEPEFPTKTPISTAYDEIRVGPRPSSPGPFSHYAPSSNGDSKLQPVSQNTTKLEVEAKREPEDDGAGCCKCVVM